MLLKNRNYRKVEAKEAKKSKTIPKETKFASLLLSGGSCQVE